MRRGGIHAARETPFELLVYGSWDGCVANRGKRATNREPRVIVHPCREACMPPLQIRGSRTRTGKQPLSVSFHGRMHAAPTMRGKQQVNRVRAAGRRPRRGLRPQARFGLAPQRRFGAQPGRKARLLARRWPTAAQRRLLGRRSRPRPAFPFLSGRRPRNTIIFHFSFLIFDFMI